MCTPKATTIVMFRCTAAHGIPKLMWCTQFLGVQNTFWLTLYTNFLYNKKLEKHPHLCQSSKEEK